MDSELMVQKELKRKNDNFALALLQRELDILQKYSNRGCVTIVDAINHVEEAIQIVNNDIDKDKQQ